MKLRQRKRLIAKRKAVMTPEKVVMPPEHLPVAIGLPVNERPA